MLRAIDAANQHLRKALLLFCQDADAGTTTYIKVQVCCYSNDNFFKSFLCRVLQFYYFFFCFLKYFCGQQTVISLNWKVWNHVVRTVFVSAIIIWKWFQCAILLQAIVIWVLHWSLLFMQFDGPTITERTNVLRLQQRINDWTTVLRQLQKCCKCCCPCRKVQPTTNY